MSWLPTDWSRSLRKALQRNAWLRHRVSAPTGGRSSGPPVPLVALAGGGVLVVGAVALWLASDRLLAGLYESWRPRLERQVGTIMGRPLQLGPYCGLSADGLCVGPSGLLAGAKDGSTAEVRRTHVLLDPLASWRQRSLVLDLSFSGARVDLRPNASGQWWLLGQVIAQFLQLLL